MEFQNFKNPHFHLSTYFSVGFHVLFVLEKLVMLFIRQAQCYECKTTTSELHLTVARSLSKPVNVTLWQICETSDF